MILVYRDTTGVSHSIPLAGRQRVTIGRDAARDVVLADRQVSRLHASVEEVMSSFLLRDAGSVNGTFLNGLRLGSASAITLREGDVIEIGGTRLFFGGAQLRLESPDPDQANAAQRIETILPLADLLRDGAAWLREKNATQDEASVAMLKAFTDAAPEVALRKALDVVVSWVDVDAAAVFMKRGKDRPVELVAARPGMAAGRALGVTAQVTRLSEEARLLRMSVEQETSSLADTMHGHTDQSVVAVPFFQGASLMGVLAAERLRGARLDRKDAAIVAVLGDRIARALSIRGTSPNDTPVSVMGEWSATVS